MTGSRRYTALGAVVVLLAGVLTLALRSDTYHVTKYELHDSGIWGTRQSDAGDPIGRLNYEIQSVDMAPAVNPSTLADPDVVQNDANVVIYSHTTNMLAQVAVAQSRVQAAQPLPADSYVGIGSTRGVVFAPGSGSLWVTDAAALGAQSYSGRGAPKPLLTVGRRSAVVVGAGGTTFAYDPDRGVIQTIAGTGARPSVSQHQLRRIGGDGAPPITAVGDEAVILDAARHELLTSSGRTLTLPSYLAESTVLQQPGGPAGSVLVASSQALATVSLHDGSIGLLSRAAAADGSYGPPVAPVALGGCEYGAWSDHGRYLQICPKGTPVSGTIDPNATAPLPVTWRVNRGRVALNDQLDGTWVTFDPHAVLGPATWLSAFGAPPKSNSQTANGQPVNADCKSTRGPTTTPFDAGVRAGSSVVIPVLQHDVDPSRCHVLAIVAASTDVVAGGAVAIASSGRALLFTPAGDQTAALLNYTVSDGTREATGTVTVHVYGAADEKPPHLIPDQATVQRGHRVSFNVLANDSDREGDPIRLLSAHIDGVPAALQPTVRADGDVTVAAAPEAGNGQRIRVAYTATDERPGGVSTDGELDVTVQTGSVRPTAAPDFASTSLNARTATGTRELRVDLLANDSVGSGNLLTLVSVQPIAGQRFRILGDGELFFTPTVVGDFSTTYVVTDGIGPATGRLRIRVTKGGSNHPPVAIPDTAQLRSDGNATVDVLANDSDPDDDVLFVSAVSVPPALAGSLQVAIVDHAGLRITAATHLTAPVTIGYTVTDGMASVPGVVTILPASSESDRQPPIVHDDQATVRVNGAAEIPVLENDLDPNGGSLSLDPKVPFTTLTGATALDPVRQGFLYAHGNALRFVAPSTPGPVHVNYNVTNGYATSTAALTINVVGDDQQNQAPQPPPLIARVFAGSSTTLTIPLLGVDPENDPVGLVGLGTPPSRGAVVGITGAAVTYRSDPADPGRGGTDMFSYWLRDDHGALGEGTVLVAVSPPPLLNTPPVPENDTVRARPGRKIRIAVTANDIDADGDPISIPFRPTKPTNAAQPTVVAGRTVEVSVPPALPDGTQITFFYAITDRINPQSALRGQVIVTVDRHARDLPVAVDDIVPGTRAPDSRATVKVPVLVNDFDPAYDRDQLKIQPSFNRSYSVDGGSIVIPVGTRSRLVSYCIQNPERETACAFVQITVGDPRNAPPVAVTDNASVSIGKSVSVDVVANDTHAPGTHLRVTTIVASHWGSAEVAAGRTVTFTPSSNAPGYGAVVYQVTDGTRSAEGILSVTVNGDQPPVLEGSLIPVVPGGSVSVSLRAHVVGGSSPADHFEVLSRQLPPGIAADLSGSTLTVSAALDAFGRTGSVVLRATNGRLSSRAALFEITVTQPPAPRAANFTAGPFKQGSPPQSIDVLAHVTDRQGSAHRLGLRAERRRHGAVGPRGGRPAPVRAPLDLLGPDPDLRDGRRRDGRGEPPGRGDGHGLGLRPADGPDGGSDRQRPHRRRDEHAVLRPRLVGRPRARERGRDRPLPGHLVGREHRRRDLRGQWPAVRPLSPVVRPRVRVSCPRRRRVQRGRAVGPGFRVEAVRRRTARGVERDGGVRRVVPDGDRCRVGASEPLHGERDRLLRRLHRQSVAGERARAGHERADRWAHDRSAVRAHDPDPQRLERAVGRRDDITAGAAARGADLRPYSDRDREPERERLGRRVVAGAFVAVRYRGDRRRRPREPPVLRRRRRWRAATCGEPGLLQLLQPDRGSCVRDQGRRHEQPRRQDLWRRPFELRALSRQHRVVHDVRPAVAGHRSGRVRERPAATLVDVHTGDVARRQPG